MDTSLILLIVAVVLILYVIWIYNRLVALKQNVSNAWSQIDVQLKRRYDLIPNLVETVKGFMKHEKETFTQVIEARNKAISAGSIKNKAFADAEVSMALSKFFAIVEAYPELKSSHNMMSLQEELKSTENKVAFARQYYNDIVTFYNTRLRVFPDGLISKIGNFQIAELFEIEAPEERKGIQVKFD